MRPEVRKGMTRTVILVGKWAFKFPSLSRGRDYLRWGLLANQREAAIYRTCPGPVRPWLGEVLLLAPGGIVLVMRRYTPACRTMTREEWSSCPLRGFENKPTSFGRTGDGVVILDYGDPEAAYRDDFPTRHDIHRYEPKPG